MPSSSSRLKQSPRSGKVRYAIVGVGHFAQTAVLPAFKHLKNSELVAIISGDQQKLSELKKKYKVEYALAYDQYDAFLASRAVDAVYIALPNSLHCDFTLRAARAGVHVLCEKPMALDVGECQQMLRACEEANVKLMVAYRLHFEKANLSVLQEVRKKRLGDLKLFNSVFTMQVKDGNIRTDAELGGGPLYDIGVYCINAARTLFSSEPEEVFAHMSPAPGDPRFKEVEAHVACTMRFSGQRLATFQVSFAAEATSKYDIIGSKGTISADPAYNHAVGLAYAITIKGKTTKKKFPKRDQVAPEIEYFSTCVAKNKTPEPSGMEGLCDVRVINAIYESAQTGHPVRLKPFSRTQGPSPTQERSLPAHGEPEVINAESPSH